MHKENSCLSLSPLGLVLLDVVFVAQVAEAFGDGVQAGCLRLIPGGGVADRDPL